MTALKLGFAVGILLGAGALAWAADPFARAESMAWVKRAVAFTKREVAAFAKFIGTDVSEKQNDEGKIEARPAIAATQSESWRDSKLPGAVRRPS
jgi:hypothetical protein